MTTVTDQHAAASSPRPLIGRRRPIAHPSARPSADRALALVAGGATGCWAALLGAVRMHGSPGFVLADLVLTSLIVTASVWLALTAMRLMAPEPTALTRVAVAAGIGCLVAGLTEPMRAILATSGAVSGAGSGVVDVLATTALVMLPVANVVADRQARKSRQDGGKN